MNKFMTATEARKKFYDVVAAASHQGVAIAITHEGIPKVVVMSYEEYEGWVETMEIMADPSMDADIQEGIREMKHSKRPKGTISLEAFKNKLKL